MQNKKSKSFILGIVVSFIIVLIPIVYVIYCLINSFIVSGVMILFLVLPFMLSLILVLIRKIPNILKMILPVLILAVTLFGFYWLNGIGGHVEFRAFYGANEINKYYTDIDFDEFGKYESISNYKYHSTGIFQQEAYTTILKYEKDNFEKQKKDIDATCAFYIDQNFSVENFNFRIEKSEWYPKELHLIGINEESYEIAYVTFEDYDLDCIDSLENFLNSYCGWHYISNERSQKK